MHDHVALARDERFAERDREHAGSADLLERGTRGVAVGGDGDDLDLGVGGLPEPLRDLLRLRERERAPRVPTRMTSRAGLTVRSPPVPA
ncbi:hypothetical protein GCM10025870_16710 [Agromyces marinus]|uniref:Uncharacterized protein n=1 Tax=Agromyces marinus TaxID=1389020 RepID=A0ABM8H1E8_9MICO|nr:hypothetical protein GCM10025870_16710 [Agromyces marinus]